MNEGTKLIAAFVLAGAIATPALAQSKRTWYAGVWGPDASASDCKITKDSPAKQYTRMKDDLISTYKYGLPKIVDEGDLVKVQNSEDPDAYLYFRSKEACLHYFAKQNAEEKEREKQEQRSLNPYR